MTLGNFRCCSQIFNTSVCTRADKHIIDLNVSHWCSWSQSHIFKRFFSCFTLVICFKISRIRNARIDVSSHARASSPSYLRDQCINVEIYNTIIFSTFVSCKLLPLSNSLFICFILRCMLTTLQIIESSFVRCDQTCSCPGFDRHIADSHPLFHCKLTDSFASVLDNISGSKVCAVLCNNAKDQVFCRNTWFTLTYKTDFQSLGFSLLQALCCHYVFYFTCTDTECKRTKRTVSRSMAVAANDRFTRVSKPELRAHNVNYALINRIEVIQSNAKITAIFRQRVDLLLRNWIFDVETIFSRYVVIHCRKGKLGTTHLASAQSQAFKGLRRSYFVYKMKIDVQNARLALFLINNVIVPDFLIHCLFNSHFRIPPKKRIQP
ncbi:hypothetical protein D3C73_924580 [compost metagenome]